LRRPSRRRIQLTREETQLKKPLAVGAVLVLGTMVFASTAQSQVKPQTLVKQRQSAMALQGKYFYPIRGMAQGRAPYDANIVTRNVGFLDALSKMPWDGFAASTKEVKSGATPAVFTETSKFKEAQDRYQAEVAKLVDVVRKGGDEPSIKQEILAVDKACDGCHDNFRERQ
jgi:cytochrome c556